MKRVCVNVFKAVYFLTAFFMFFQLNARAYIDAGAVTYVIQAVAAVIIALGAGISIFGHKIKKLFNKNDKKEKEEIIVDEDIANVINASSDAASEEKGEEQNVSDR